MINGNKKSKATALLAVESLTRAQVADRLNMSVRHIDRLLTLGTRTKGREGIYPYFRVGRAVRIPVTSIESFMEVYVCHA